MKVYTKKGDLGKTSILGENDIDKDDLRINAYGTVDELNSFVGQLSCFIDDRILLGELRDIQNVLFCVGSELASTPDVFQKLNLDSVGVEEIDYLEKSIDRQTNELPVLQSFVLPGGSLSNATAHIARTVCRRAERKCVTLSKVIEIRPEIITYLNRLSDYFFTVARTMTVLTNSEEIEWKPKNR